MRRVNLRSKPGAKPFSGQRLSDWRLGRSIPARFDFILPVLSVLIEEAKTQQGARAVDASLVDMNEWHAAWLRAREVAPSAPSADHPPYRGREPYRPEDAEIFFGRRAAVNALERLIATARQESPHRLVLLLGSAGAGKSSLLEAGLRGDKDESRSVSVRLADSPVAALRCAMSEIGAPDGEPVTVFIDQAEELFTRCRDAEERQRFLAELDRLTSDPARPDLLMVMAFRAEHARELAEYPLFAEALETRSLTMAALSDEELREIIVRPVVERGGHIEPALVEVVLRDIELLSLRAETALPRLLAPVLTTVWDRRARQTSTLAAYQAIGGLEGEVAASAERAWTELTEFERSTARQIIVSLLVPGGWTGRDRVPRSVLVDEALSPGTADAVIDRLEAAGVLAISGADVEIRNNALLSAWPRLNEWLASDRHFAPLRRRLEMDARAWVAHGRARRLLYRGARLRESAALLRLDAGWNRTVREFLSVSEKWRQRRILLRAVAASVSTVILLAAAAHLYFG